MICHSCGTKNKEDAAFCTECGSKLDQHIAKNHCPACGFENEKESSYCSECGTFLKQGKKRASAKETKRTGNKRKPVETSNTSVKLILGIAAVVIVSILLAKNFSGKQNIASVQPPLQSEQPRPFLDSNTLAVAQQFRCSCGSCGGTPLEQCSCPTATKELNFIAESLRSGASIEETAAKVDSAFGWKKIISSSGETAG